MVDWFDKSSVRDATDRAREYISACALDLQDELRQFYVGYLVPTTALLMHHFVEFTEALDGYLERQMQHGINTMQDGIQRSLLYSARSACCLLGQKNGSSVGLPCGVGNRTDDYGELQTKHEEG